MPDTTREEAAWGDYDLAVAAELRRAAKEDEVRDINEMKSSFTRVIELSIFVFVSRLLFSPTE